MKKLFSLIGGIAAVVVFTGAGCLSLNDTPEATGVAGMFASPDQGESWSQISSMPQVEGVTSLADISVFRLIQDPQDPNTLYWASRNGGLLYSYDMGRSWNRFEKELASGFIYDVSVDAQDKCHIVTTKSKNVYSTTDCGRTWQSIYSESSADTIASVAIDPYSPLNIFIATSQGKILQSSDGGVSWRVLARLNTDIRDIMPDKFKKDIIYVASKKEGLYRSDDGGKTFKNLKEKMENFADSDELRRFVAYTGREGVLFWISDYGILKSEDRGETWKAFELTNPPGIAKIYGFAVNPKNENELYYTATIGIRSTFFRSTDGGVNWVVRKLPTGQTPTALHIHPEQTNIIYAGFTILPKS